MQFLRNPRLNFVGNRRKALYLSLSVILIALVSVALHRGLNTGIDFAGGTLVEVRLHGDPVPLKDIRAIVEGCGFPSAEVTHFGFCGDVGCSGEGLFDPLLDGVEVLVAHEAVHLPAVLEDDDRGHTADAELPGGARGLFHVDVVDVQATAVLLGHSLDRGRERLARLAPDGGEVDHDGHLGVAQGAFEVGVSELLEVGHRRRDTNSGGRGFCNRS